MDWPAGFTRTSLLTGGVLLVDLTPDVGCTELFIYSLYPIETTDKQLSMEFPFYKDAWS